MKNNKDKKDKKVTDEVRKRLRRFYGIVDPGDLRVEFYDQEETIDIAHEVIEPKKLEDGSKKA